MSAHNGLKSRVLDLVAASPGLTLAGCVAALQHGTTSVKQVLYRACKAGLIFGAGHRYSRHYFATQEQADAAHQALLEAFAARQRKSLAAEWRRQNDKRKRQRRLRASLPAGATLHRDFKLTRAQTPPGRYAPAPGFEGAITQDWLARRTAAER